MSPQNSSPDRVLSLRPITPEDEDFLCRLYASTREDELAPLDWDEDQKQAFLRMQFEAQHKFYLEQFSQAEFNIILLNGEPVGRLYTDLRSDEIRIIDIALLTAYRRQGIGSIYLKKVMTEAKEAGLAVRIHVEHYNPAMSLYRRLGFKKIDDGGIYFLMEWSPDSQ